MRPQRQPRRRGHERAGKRNACPTNLLRYRDKAEADLVVKFAAKARANGNTRRQECRSFECEFCNGWHTSKQPYREQGEDHEQSQAASEVGADPSGPEEVPDRSPGLM